MALSRCQYSVDATEKGLVKELSRCLQLDEGELPLDLLPELQELTYSGSGDTGNAFTLFVKGRQDVGRSIALLRRNPSPDPSSRTPSPLQVEPPSTKSANGKARSDLDT